MSIVAKFGGSSVANTAQVAKAIAIAKKHMANGVVLVASAMGDTTDRLIEIIDATITGHQAHALEELNALRERHLAELEGVRDHQARLHGVKRIELLCDEMQEVCVEIAVQRRGTDMQRAYLLAHGELLATTVIYAIARDNALPCRLLDSREFIKTDEQPLKGEVDWEASERLIHEYIDLKNKTLYIAQGFIASTPGGRTTTLGRGGSDYSAALIGAALAVGRIEIWTDVDGILTTDPRIVRTATPIKTLSYSEAAELAYFGATVLHPSTMVPAIKKKIPLVVRNINNPTHHGTRICQRAQKNGVRAIAMKNNITVINIQSYRMLNAYGFLSRIFAVFAAHNTAVDVITTSEVSVSLTIDDDSAVQEISSELEQFAKVELKGGQAIVSIVAQNLWRDARAVTRAFTALAGVPIQMVSLGGSDTNLSVVVGQQYVMRAVRALHSSFFD